MRRINLYDLVQLGEAIFKATTIESETEPINAWVATYDLKRILLKIRDEGAIDLGISNHNLSELISVIDVVAKRVTEKDENGDKYKELGWSIEHQLRQKIESFKTVLSAEFRGATSYYVQIVGIYSTNDLIENATSKFSELIIKGLPEDALIQFQEAARCLSFGLHTACGFHMMRAVEYVLLDLMQTVCGNKITSLNANWGAYIAELEKIIQSSSRKKPTTETVDLLRQMKNNHRNPVMHAEISLNYQEAIDLFDLGAVVMSHLSEELLRLKRSRKK